jgi:hypothetical protein
MSPTRKPADRLADIIAHHNGSGADTGCEQCTVVAELQRVRAQLEEAEKTIRAMAGGRDM